MNANLRQNEFPWAHRGDAIYLNHASTGPLPERAVQALAHWNRLRAEPWRLTPEFQFAALTKGRAQCAAFIGAMPGEIAMMVNTSYGINFAARALPLGAGDVVVTSRREFPANIYPWMGLAANGVELHLTECRDRLADEDALIAALDRPRVKALTVSWVSFETGKRLNLERLGRACRERDVFFAVDAIQGLGAAPLDVHACHIDLLACGAQKWLLSPWGTGFLYVRSGLVEQLQPHDIGWLSLEASQDFNRFCEYSMAWVDGAQRFEVCTLPFQDFAGMNATLDLFLETGLATVHSLVEERATQIVDWARRRRDVRLVTPVDPSQRAGIVSLVPADPVASYRRLADGGVSCALREGAIRLAPHFYNTAEEVERALALI